MLLSSVSISTALCCAGRCRPTRTNRRHLCCRSSGKSAGRRRLRRTRCPWRARAERSSEVYRCSGGNDQLAECLKKEIEERGGRVQLPTPASRKMLDSNDICVRAKGEDYRGKWVVVAVPPPAGTLWNSRSTPLHIASLPVLHSSSSRTRKNDFGCATVSLQTPRICTIQNGRLVWAGEHKRRCCNAEPTNLLGPLVCLLSRKEEILNSPHSTPQLCLAFVLNGFILRSLAHGRSLHQSPRCLFCFPSVWLWFSRLPSGKAR